jgi:Hint domain
VIYGCVQTAGCGGGLGVAAAGVSLLGIGDSAWANIQSAVDGKDHTSKLEDVVYAACMKGGGDATGCGYVALAASIAVPGASDIKAIATALMKRAEVRAAEAVAAKASAATCPGGVCKGPTCFIAGTPVATATGLRGIETIQVGDQVVSRDQKGGRTVLRPVARLVKRVAAAVLAVSLTANSGGLAAASETLTTTPDHPFHIACPPPPGRDTCGFVPAGSLHVGDVVSGPEDAPETDPLFTPVAFGTAAARHGLRVTALALDATPTVVYNFEVSDTHT